MPLYPIFDSIQSQFVAIYEVCFFWQTEEFWLSQAKVISSFWDPSTAKKKEKALGFHEQMTMSCFRDLNKEKLKVNNDNDEETEEKEEAEIRFYKFR